MRLAFRRNYLLPVRLRFLFRERIFWWWKKPLMGFFFSAILRIMSLVEILGIRVCGRPKSRRALNLAIFWIGAKYLKLLKIRSSSLFNDFLSERNVEHEVHMPLLWL